MGHASSSSSVEPSFEGDRNGSGRLTTKCGDVYEGVFNEGTIVKGKLFMARGGVFEGVFEGGRMREGKLKCGGSGGGTYVGSFAGNNLRRWHPRRRTVAS